MCFHAAVLGINAKANLFLIVFRFTLMENPRPLISCSNLQSAHINISLTDVLLNCETNFQTSTSLFLTAFTLTWCHRFSHVLLCWF